MWFLVSFLLLPLSSVLLIIVDAVIGVVTVNGFAAVDVAVVVASIFVAAAVVVVIASVIVVSVDSIGGVAVVTLLLSLSLSLLLWKAKNFIMVDRIIKKEQMRALSQHSK